MNKRKVNITFQTRDFPEQKWEDAPIVYVLYNEDIDKDVDDVSRCISVMSKGKTVRITKLYLDDELTPKGACKRFAHYFYCET